jgi:hypothetical protein
MTEESVSASIFHVDRPRPVRALADRQKDDPVQIDKGASPIRYQSTMLSKLAMLLFMCLSLKLLES